MLCLVSVHLGSISYHRSSVHSAQLAAGNITLRTAVQGLLLVFAHTDHTAPCELIILRMSHQF